MNPKKILILGGGFAGVTILRKIQNKFKNQEAEITLVSDDNFFLFTPLLPEVCSGMLHPSDVSTPVREFCKNAKFYHAHISGIDLEKQEVSIQRIFDNKLTKIDYDYLVIAFGSINNFFGNKNMEEHSFTIKTLEDALAIRNHVINMLERADNEDNPQLQDELLNFVVIGGGFAGVETASELNHFIRSAIRNFYKNINPKMVRVILVSAKKGILPEVGDELGDIAFRILQKTEVQIFNNIRAVDAGDDFVLLSDKTIIPCTTLIWAGGVIVDPLISSIECNHGPSGRLIVDDYLRISEYPNVYALGDCAHAIDKKTKSPYPPTAQVALKQATTVSNNLIYTIKGNKKLKPFDYSNRGIMATIGKRSAVALIRGRKIHGFLAWILWRTFYLSNLPTNEKKVRVALEWFLDLFFRRGEILSVGSIKRKTIAKIDTPMQAVFDVTEEEHL